MVGRDRRSIDGRVRAVMTDVDFAHLIEIDTNARLLKIHRVFMDGRRHFLTEMPLPAHDGDQLGDRFAQFARVLGENILMDSPAARRTLGL
jgi:hypothetical protein